MPHCSNTHLTAVLEQPTPGDQPDALRLANLRMGLHVPSTVAQDATRSIGATAASAEPANSRGLRAAPPVEAQPVELDLALDREPLLRQSALASKPRS